MNTIDLKQLYDATEEDLRFGIGLLDVPGRGQVPFIQIHQPGWSREMLEIVRDSFRDGLALVSGKRASGTVDLHIATRQRVAIQADEQGHTSLLCGPAWNATLSDIAPAIARRFQADRARLGGFLLLMQTVEWEFVTGVHDSTGRTDVGPLAHRRFPMPPKQ